ncbi:MAG: GNAT family N-acetyltransferase [Alphaproteobacteria bacterium]|nr:GNAT family N-acetyltransferase [Alphaproteobacteria bacterium]
MAVIEVSIPVLQTPRLILRSHELKDFEATVDIWSDPIVRKHFGARPFTREDIWARFLRQSGMWAVMGYGAWAVEEKSTGAYVGTVGVFDVRREFEPPEPSLAGLPEAGWTLSPRVHGKGYATEAAKAALAWADRRFGGIRMWCMISPANVASIRVAEKCGFRFWKETTYRDDPILLFLREKVESA